MSENALLPENETPVESPNNLPTEPVGSNQNLLMAIVGGVISSIVAAILWAVITYLTGYKIGFVAVGVGFVVGFAVNLLGKGKTMTFGIVGAVFALLGCVLGNLFTAVISAALQEKVPIFDIISTFLLSPTVVIEIMKMTFSPMDLLFYAIAIYEGFKFSFSSDSVDS